MKKLVALNTTQALYYDDGRSLSSFTPKKYIADLLAIRSPKGLVRFLDDYPEGFVAPRILASRDETSQALTPAWFSEEKLTKATYDVRDARKIDIDWLDNLTDNLENRFPAADIVHISQGQYEEWMAEIIELAFLELGSDCFKAELKALSDAYFIQPGSQLEVMNLAELKTAQTQLENLLTMAAFSSGDYEPTFDINLEEVAEDPTGARQFAKVVISAEAACALLPDVVPLDEFNTMWHGHKIGSYSDDEQMCFYQAGDKLYAHYPINCALDAITDSEVKEIKRVVAGHLTAWALMEWVGKYSRSQSVVFDAKSGFTLQSLHASAAADCLCELVANKNVGLCRRCGRPFVVQRRNADGSSFRTYCSSACKVNDYGVSHG